MIVLLLALLACDFGGEDTAAVGGTDPACGDVDGPGGDTGDVPSVIGTWTSTFGNGWYEDNCSADNFDATSESWIGAFWVEGAAPTNLYVYFGPEGDPRTERFWGAVDPQGGFTFSGTQEHSAGTIHASFFGKVWADPNNQGRVTISGAAFLGLDVDDDDVVDCYARGAWQAYQSG